LSVTQEEVCIPIKHKALTSYPILPKKKNQPINWRKTFCKKHSQ
jgi:hypothetical protein